MIHVWKYHIKSINIMITYFFRKTVNNLNYFMPLVNFHLNVILNIRKVINMFLDTWIMFGYVLYIVQHRKFVFAFCETISIQLNINIILRFICHIWHLIKYYRKCSLRIRKILAPNKFLIMRIWLLGNF